MLINSTQSPVNCVTWSSWFREYQVGGNHKLRNFRLLHNHHSKGLYCPLVDEHCKATWRAGTRTQTNLNRVWKSQENGIIRSGLGSFPVEDDELKEATERQQLRWRPHFTGTTERNAAWSSFPRCLRKWRQYRNETEDTQGTVSHLDQSSWPLLKH